MSLYKWLPSALVLFLGAACGDYAIQLPGKYQLTRVHGAAVVINHPDRGVIIDANVDGYALMGKLIVGHVSLAEHAPERELSRPGYFIVDTSTDHVEQGLDKNSWLNVLRAAGITQEPKLAKPSRFDSDYQSS